MHANLKTIVTIVMILLCDRSQAGQPVAVDSLNDANSQHALPNVLDSLNQNAHADIDLQSNRHDASRDDRLWMISTRHLSSEVRRVNLDSVDFRIAQLDRCGNQQSDQFDSFLSSLSPDRVVVIHVHGNRLTEPEANERGRFVYRSIKYYAADIPMDFVVFSWPSEQNGCLLRDGRAKAGVTEAESLYFATLLRELVTRNIPVAIVAYSFGSRVTSGALHCLAGGALSGRRLPTEPIVGANIAVGMVAPAVQADWLGTGRYHGLAAKNIADLAILYNSRDAVLRRYWLVERDSRGPALGYVGPTRIALGFDGSPVPLVKCDCAKVLGWAHKEREYYTGNCRAGRTLATLIRQAR